MRFLIVSLTLSLLFLAGCSTSYREKISDSESSFYGGEYEKAARSLLPQVNKKGKDQLLYMLEAGTMLHTAGKYEDSNRVFLAAAKLAEETPISFTKQSASLLLNERSTNYAGEDFERVLIHMYIGLNYMLLDNFDSARVEFQRISYLLRDIKNNGGPDYNQNIMAKYLTAICYEHLYTVDSDEQALEYAYTEYKQIYQLSPKLKMVQKDLLRVARQLGELQDFKEWQNQFGKLSYENTEENGELVVIHQAGRGAYKKSRGSLLEDAGMKGMIIVSVNAMTLEQGVTIAAILIALNNIEHPIPDYKVFDNSIKNLRILDETGDVLGTTVMLENIDSTAQLSAKERYDRTKANVAAGIAVKAAATVASSIAAEKIAEQTSLKEGSKVIGFLTGAAVGTTLASQIKPDLRCWHTLPSNLQISRIALKPGTYTISTQFISKNGSSYGKRDHTITISAGEKSVISMRSLK